MGNVINETNATQHECPVITVDFAINCSCTLHEHFMKTSAGICTFHESCLAKTEISCF